MSRLTDFWSVLKILHYLKSHKIWYVPNLIVPKFIFMDPIGNKPEGFHGLFIYSRKIINSSSQFCDIHKAQYFRVSNLLLPFVIFVNFNLHRCSYMITCIYISMCFYSPNKSYHILF